MHLIEALRTIESMPESTRRMVENVYPLLVEINDLRKKVTGVGDWGPGALILGAILAALAHVYSGPFLPEALNTPTFLYNLPFGFALLLIPGCALAYGLGLAIGNAWLGTKLKGARARLNEMYHCAEHRADFFPALAYISQFESALVENLNQDIRKEFRAWVKYLTTPRSELA